MRKNKSLQSKWDNFRKFYPKEIVELSQLLIIGDITEKQYVGAYAAVSKRYGLRRGKALQHLRFFKKYFLTK